MCWLISKFWSRDALEAASWKRFWRLGSMVKGGNFHSSGLRTECSNSAWLNSMVVSDSSSSSPQSDSWSSTYLITPSMVASEQLSSLLMLLSSSSESSGPHPLPSALHHRKVDLRTGHRGGSVLAAGGLIPDCWLWPESLEPIPRLNSDGWSVALANAVFGSLRFRWTSHESHRDEDSLFASRRFCWTQLRATSESFRHGSCTKTTPLLSTNCGNPDIRSFRNIVRDWLMMPVEWW